MWKYTLGLNYIWKNTLFDLFSSKIFLVVVVHLSFIVKEFRGGKDKNLLLVDLDIHVVIFVAN